MRIVVLALEDTQSLDVLGPVEVFDAASRLGAAGAPAYEIEVVTPGGSKEYEVKKVEWR